MNREPIPGLSDQRYFHVAVLSRRKGLSLNWIWGALETGAQLGPGRLPSLANGLMKHECRTITESATYAGSPDSVKALATSDDSKTCDYDVFGSVSKDVAIFGSGYSRLTHHLARRLVQQRMMERGWFLKPKLNSIAEMFQKPSGTLAKRAARLDMAFQATGLSAIYRGSKNFQGLRFTGADVFGEGFIEMVAGWLENTAAKVDIEEDSSESPFGYKMMRINAIDRRTGGCASLTTRPDGSYKVWLRKGGANLPEVSNAFLALSELGLLEERAEVPRWADDEEL